MTTTRTRSRNRSHRHLVVAIVSVAVLVMLGPLAAASGGARTPTPTSAPTPTPTPTSTSTAGGGDHQVLRFAVAFSPFNIVDVEPAAEFDGDYRAGDYVTFHDVLLDRSGERVGVEAGSGLITRVSPSGVQVAYTMTIRLPRGQVTAQGLGSASPTKRLAVTGGTRRYVGAEGAVELVENADQTGTVVITLHR